MAKRQAIRRVLKRAGLPYVRFHDLRHMFATLALQNGVDVKTVPVCWAISAQDLHWTPTPMSPRWPSGMRPRRWTVCWGPEFDRKQRKEKSHLRNHGFPGGFLVINDTISTFPKVIT